MHYHSLWTDYNNRNSQQNYGYLKIPKIVMKRVSIQRTDGHAQHYQNDTFFLEPKWFQKRLIKGCNRRKMY